MAWLTQHLTPFRTDICMENDKRREIETELDRVKYWEERKRSGDSDRFRVKDSDRVRVKTV